MNDHLKLCKMLKMLTQWNLSAGLESRDQADRSIARAGMLKHDKIDDSCSGKMIERLHAIMAQAFVGTVKLYAIVAFCLVQLTQYSTYGDDVRGDESKGCDVRKFLQDAPPLKKIVFGISGDRFSANGKALDGYVYFEAAYQQNTFYVRHLTNAPGQPKAFLMPGKTAGCTADGTLWNIDWNVPGGIITSARLDDPSYKTSSAWHSSELLRGQLTEIRSLGMHLLRLGTLRWLDERRFEAEADLPEGIPLVAGAKPLITGEIASTDEKGRPTRIEWACPALAAVSKMWIEFQYKKAVGNTDLPNLILASIQPTGVFAHASGPITHSFILEHVEVGTDISLAGGYAPGQFISSSTNAPKPYLLVESNTVTYQYDGGHWREIKPGSGRGPSQSRSKTIVSYFFVTAAILGGVFLFLFKKKIN